MANRSFEMYEYRQALLHMRQGATDRAIARSGVMGRRKVGELRKLARSLGWLEMQTPLPDDSELAKELAAPQKQASSSASPLSAHHHRIKAWLDDDIQLTTIYGLLKRTCKYTGSYSSVRRYATRLRGPKSKATMRLQFAPGDAAQVDFGTGPKLPDPKSGKPRSTWIFVMTLCWSRHQYAEIVWNQKTPTWLGCHQRAFRFFGGIVSRVILDNAACAIVRACRKDPGVQRAYYEQAEAYGFKLDICPPRRPAIKGRVESGVKYIKRSFLAGREFRDLSSANRELERWVLEDAGQRIHGTTQERPLTRFAEVEKQLLRPLPERAYEPSQWSKKKLARDCHVRVDHAFYSAPWIYIAESLWVRTTATMVQIFRGHELIATHTRCQQPGEKRTVVDHLPPGAQAFLRQTPSWCREQADKVGSACRTVIDLLLHDAVVERLPAAKGILQLGEKYGKARLESACRRALSFDDPRYRTVKTILSRGLDQLAYTEETFDALCDTYTGGGKFSRDTRNLLSH